MSMMSIRVQRDSVCAGDDIEAPHKYEFEIKETCTLKDLFKHIERVNYLPKVMGKNHQWLAQVEGVVVARFKGNRKKPMRALNLKTRLINLSANANIRLTFKYVSAET